MQILPNIYSVSLLLWYSPQDTLYEGRTTRVSSRRGAVPHQPVQQGLRLLLLVVFVRVGLGGRRRRAAFTIDVLLPVITPSEEFYCDLRIKVQCHDIGGTATPGLQADIYSFRLAGYPAIEYLFF